MATACWFNWHTIYNEQLPSYDGRKAIVVEVRHNQGDSFIYLKELVERLKLQDSVTLHSFDNAGAAGQFKDGECAFVFIDCEHTYEKTLEHLRAWGRTVHYNSAMAGHGIRIPEVRRAVEDYCKESPVPLPWRIINECWQINHMHRPGQIV